MTTPDKSRGLDGLPPVGPPPPRPTEEELAAKYAGPNPWLAPDPQGDAEVPMRGGVSTPATRAVTRAKLAAAWEEGRKAFAARRSAA